MSHCHMFVCHMFVFPTLQSLPPLTNQKLLLQTDQGTVWQGGSYTPGVPGITNAQIIPRLGLAVQLGSGSYHFSLSGAPVDTYICANATEDDRVGIACPSPLVVSEICMLFRPCFHFVGFDLWLSIVLCNSAPLAPGFDVWLLFCALGSARFQLGFDVWLAFLLHLCRSKPSRLLPSAPSRAASRKNSRTLISSCVCSHHSRARAPLRRPLMRSDCHAGSSQAVVESMCLNQPYCTVPVSCFCFCVRRFSCQACHSLLCVSCTRPPSPLVAEMLSREDVNCCIVALHCC